MTERQARRGAVALGAAIGKALGPVTARRGFARADLLGAWDAVVGERYAGFTQPEKIAWPRDGEARGGVLTVRVDGARAVLLQHDLPQFIERINAFLGYGAIASVRIVQRPLPRPARPAAAEPPPLPAEDAAALEAQLEGVSDPDLRDSLRRLGTGVLGDGLAER